MALKDEHDVGRLRLIHDDFVADGSGSGRAMWPTVDDHDVPVEHEARPEPALSEADPETDNLVVQYFGDVRQFALLNRDEERALWARIEYLKQRVHRALYMSPVCLPTLEHLWEQVERGELALHNLLAEAALDTASGATPETVFEAAMLTLQDLRPRLQRGKARKRSARRARRQERAELWRQWIATCEALPLLPFAHEMLHDALETALQEQPDHPALRAADQAWSRAHHALEEAKASMLRANLRLVIYVAKRFRNEDVPFLDLIQEGNIGLMRALDKFEPSRGLKFVTYAHWWVRQAIGRAIIEQRRTVRLPNHVVERKNKLRAAETKLWQVHKRAPSAQELAVELGWDPGEVETLQETQHVMVRLHEPLSDDGKRLEEAIEDDHRADPDAVVAQLELQRRVADCLGDLSEREADIVRLRFGLDTDHPCSLKEVGERYGLSRERIRQIEVQALRKLRASRNGAALADFVNVA